MPVDHADSEKEDSLIAGGREIRIAVDVVLVAGSTDAPTAWLVEG